mmetsp:Transcript_14375/g.49982  ORF Transcript_14375/g.49982 Transcript_14375/m.49982 type:complete len:569 (-) Transcript_14375:207-1913(-)
MGDAGEDHGRDAPTRPRELHKEEEEEERSESPIVEIVMGREPATLPTTQFSAAFRGALKARGADGVRIFCPAMCSSGDCYHYLAWMMLCASQGWRQPPVTIAYDSTSAKCHAERAKRLASLLGFPDDMVTVKKVTVTTPRPNVRSSQLRECLIDGDTRPARVVLLDQKSCTVLLAQFAREQGLAKLHGILCAQVEGRLAMPTLATPRARSESESTAADEGKGEEAGAADAGGAGGGEGGAAAYTGIGGAASRPVAAGRTRTCYRDAARVFTAGVVHAAIIRTAMTRRGCRKLVILNNRYSDATNDDQNLQEGERKMISERIALDSSVAVVQLDAWNKDIPPRLRSNAVVARFDMFKLVRGTMTASAGDGSGSDEDLAKAGHLALLVALRRSLPADGLCVVGGTSGTLDIAAFLGIPAFCIHDFKETKTLTLDYQDLRVQVLQFLGVTLAASAKAEGAGLTPPSGDGIMTTERRLAAWLGHTLRLGTGDSGVPAAPPLLKLAVRAELPTETKLRRKDKDKIQARFVRCAFVKGDKELDFAHPGGTVIAMIKVLQDNMRRWTVKKKKKKK